MEIKTHFLSRSACMFIYAFFTNIAFSFKAPITAAADEILKKKFSFLSENKMMFHMNHLPSR